MRELLQIEEYPDFAAAAGRARKLAVDFGEAIQLRRTADGWAVLAPDTVSIVLERAHVEEADDAWFDAGEADDEDPVADDYQHDVLAPLLEEFHADQEDWARSEEDGWYYADD